MFCLAAAAVMAFAIILPANAADPTGTWLIQDGTAKVQPVKVDRTAQGMSVISEGLAGDESVVVDGQLLLSDGTRIEPRAKKTCESPVGWTRARIRRLISPRRLAQPRFSAVSSTSHSFSTRAYRVLTAGISSNSR